MRTLLDRYGVTVHQGTGRFVDPHTVRVARPSPPGGTFDLRAEKIVVAIGSRPVRPAVFPFEHPRVHDSDELLFITSIPRSLAVIGGGVIGSEYACMFAALGVRVHLIDGRDVLLPFLDPDLSGRAGGRRWRSWASCSAGRSGWRRATRRAPARSSCG